MVLLVLTLIWTAPLHSVLNKTMQTKWTITNKKKTYIAINPMDFVGTLAFVE